MKKNVPDFSLRMTMSQLKKSPSIHSTLCMSSLALFLLFKIVNHFSLTFVIGVYVVVGRVRLQSP